MEFVSAQDRSRLSQRAIRGNARLPIAERHASLFEACLDVEQSGHPMRRPLGVDETRAKRHVTPAFAMDVTRLREAPEPLAKSFRRRHPARVQLGIAAGKPAYVAIVRGRLVGERREANDLGPGRPPAPHDMGVDEREGRVAGERDALTRGLQGDRSPLPRAKTKLARQRKDPIAINMRFDRVGNRLEPRLQLLRLARLNQAQMALRQRNSFASRQCPDDRNPNRLDCPRREPAMALAADAIERTPATRTRAS